MPGFARFSITSCAAVATVCLPVLIIFPGSAHSQNNEPFPNNPYYSDSREAIPRRTEEKSAAELKLFHTGTNAFQRRPDAVNPWSRKLEKSGDEYRAAGKVAPEKKTTHLNYLSPMEGQLAAMKAGAFASLLDKSLEGALTEYNVTLTQTEPALAAGVHNAYMQAGVALTNRYLAEDNFNEQLKANPHARDHVLSAYNSCMYRLMNPQGSEGSGEVTKTVSWVEASAICSGDTLKDPSEEFAADDLEKAAEKSWKGRDHTDEHRDSSDPHVTNDHQISIVDMIFGQLLKQSSGDSKSKIEKQRNAWLDWFGDYLISTDEKQGSSRAVAEQRIEPKEDAAAIILKIQDKRYEDLLLVLEKLCDAKKDMLGDKEDSNIARLLIADKKNPWSNESEGTPIPDEQIHNLSTQGAPFAAVVGEAMLNTYLSRHLGSEATMEDMQCSQVFSPTTGVCAPEKVKANSPYIETCTMYWRYASIVGVGQFYSSLREAERFIMERTGGLREHELASLALRMVYETAKTADLEGAQIANIVKLEQLVTLFFQYRTQRSGSGSLTSTIKNKSIEKANEWK